VGQPGILFGRNIDVNARIMGIEGWMILRVSCPVIRNGKVCGGHRRVERSYWVCTKCGSRIHIFNPE
jgi:ribosomal protein L37AE/L43A